MPADALLPLDAQNAYRDRYRAMRPGWRSSGDQLEALVRSYLSPDSHVLDLGCGRGGVVELFWREVRLAAGLDPDVPSLAEHRAPGTWMHDALDVRDDWESRLLRTSTWSPIA